MKAASKPKFTPKSRKEKDEDLLLFREMFKRENERNVVSLLEPVSSEFEPSQGSFPFYKLPSFKKNFGNDFLGSDKEKNDYDWLKTPPATPLFPSLEMEANNSNMIFQRELPLLQNIRTASRFSTKTEEKKQEQAPKSPSSRSTTSTKSHTSSQSGTSTSRPTSSYVKPATHKNTNTSANIQEGSKSTIRAITNSNNAIKIEKPRNSVSSRTQATNRKPQSRGVSPMRRPIIPSNIRGFPDKAPPNLITSKSVIEKRATSATRGRAVNSAALPAVEREVENRRQSCSPGVTRGRKVETLDGKVRNNNSSGNGNFVIGSKMVEKMMNARRPGGKEEHGLQSTVQNQSQIGRLLSKTSVDAASKQWETSRNQAGRKLSTASVNSGTTKKTGSEITATSCEVRNFRNRTGGESKFGFKRAESKVRST